MLPYIVYLVPKNLSTWEMFVSEDGNAGVRRRAQARIRRMDEPPEMPEPDQFIIRPSIPETMVQEKVSIGEGDMYTKYKMYFAPNEREAILLAKFLSFKNPGVDVEVAETKMIVTRPVGDALVQKVTDKGVLPE